MAPSERLASFGRDTTEERTMFSKATLLGLGLVLMTAGFVSAGEPTGRYNGAPGSDPQGAEQVYFADFGNGTNSHYMPADGESIPTGNVPAAALDKGTTTHYSPADTATIAAPTQDNTAVASH
jgi:hypothetical protein